MEANANTRAHLICRHGLNLKVVQMPTFESGIWDNVTVSEDDAKRLVGGMLYLHETKNEPSYFGGVITGYRLAERDNTRARKDGWIFTIVSSLSGKGEKWSTKGRHDMNAHYSGVIEE